MKTRASWSSATGDEHYTIGFCKLSTMYNLAQMVTKITEIRQKRHQIVFTDTIELKLYACYMIVE